MARVVIAAGGVVCRTGASGVEVLLVHRPRYDDWTLPKGKAERGETPEQTAQREVLEETGLACTIGPPVAQARYEDQRGRPKLVHYFAMQVAGGPSGAADDPFVPNDEVDAIAWLPIDSEARARLSYPRDVEVLDAARGVVC